MGRVVFDFDGVVHSYTSGWQGDTVISDPPVPGIRVLFKRLQAAGYTVCIVSSRSSYPAGRAAMWQWCQKHNIPVNEICATKPPARCYVDDRAIRFDGTTDGLFEIIDHFEPWWNEPDYRGEYERR